MGWPGSRTARMPLRPDILFLPMVERANSLEQHSADRGTISDLRHVNVLHLEPLLLEEMEEWRRELSWDFSPSAALVRQYAGTSSLGGAALMVNGEVAGYGYAVIEEPRGIIGDLYVKRQFQLTANGPGYEAELFRSLLDALATTRNVRRVESQLMLSGPAAAVAIRDENRAHGRALRLYERRLMLRSGAPELPEAGGDLGKPGHFRTAGWEDRFLHAASIVIAGAYYMETDSEINEQYRSPAGARRFLGNIVEFPGCGTFHRESSFLAFDPISGEPAGMVLTSFVAGGIGHISQLCVMPEARGMGLGKTLLRMAIAALHEHGARDVSLTVTATNRKAIAIYEKFGFRNMRAFFAYIWEG